MVLGLKYGLQYTKHLITFSDLHLCCFSFIQDHQTLMTRQFEPFPYMKNLCCPQDENDYETF